MVTTSSFDSFGNPVDRQVGYARGAYLQSSADEVRRLRAAQWLAATRVRDHGAGAISLFTGSVRGFPIKPSDIETTCEEWVGGGLVEPELSEIARTHLGGGADDSVAVFNRTSGGVISAIASMSNGRPVLSITPAQGSSHVSVARGAEIARVPVREAAVNEAWGALLTSMRPHLVVVTTVTSSLDRMEDADIRRIVDASHSGNAAVLLDEAYGARIRTVLHGGVPSLQLGADLTITNTDKAGLPGPRAGVMCGKDALVVSAHGWASGRGLEARAPIAAAVLRSLASYTPDLLLDEVQAGNTLTESFRKRWPGIVHSTDLGPLIHEDDLLTEVLARAPKSDHLRMVPCEATAAVGALLLRDYGIITVNTHGQPGARVSLRLKPTLRSLGRCNGASGVADALDDCITNLASLASDDAAVRGLLFGDQQ